MREARPLRGLRAGGSEGEGAAAKGVPGLGHSWVIAEIEENGTLNVRWRVAHSHNAARNLLHLLKVFCFGV